MAMENYSIMMVVDMKDNGTKIKGTVMENSSTIMDSLHIKGTGSKTNSMELEKSIMTLQQC